MSDSIDTLMVDVRASTAGFESDIATMRSAVDGALVSGFAQAGTVLERGLTSAIRSGSLGFDDLKRVALQTMDQIAAQAVRGGIGSPVGGGTGSGSNGLGSILSGAVGALLGLPGRATGAPVSPGQAYQVGERGPELFVPTSAGRIEPAASTSGRNVSISIQVAQPRGADAPAALQRSSRQIASSVRRALSQF